MTALEFVALRIAVATLSDSRSLEDDRSGSLLAERIERSGHVLVERVLLSDDVEGIRLAARRLADSGGVDVLLTSGGTGLTGRDNAPEAFEPLFSKRIDGFAVLFHAISREKIGTSTIQSRCCAGTIGGMLVFCLPGSPSACRDAWDEILVHQLDSRHRPCNFAEILPRLSEDSAIRRRRP